jgi:integrase
VYYSVPLLVMSALTTQPKLEIVPQQVRSDAHLCQMWLVKGNKRDRTCKAYAGAANRLWEWMTAAGVESLRELTAAELLEYIETFPTRWSDATRNQQIAALKSLWSFGHSLGYFPINITGILTLGKPQPVLPERILTRPEVMAAIDAEPFRTNRLLIQLLFGTGLRISEALALEWGDLGEINGQPRITVRDGKGGKARVVGCFRSTWEALLDVAPQQVRTNVPILPYAYITCYGWVRTAFERVGIPQVSPHWLRHASAISMRGVGMDWPDIANQLGHADPGITLKAYSHLSESHQDAFEHL